jgi:4-phytase/acid phosphatase
VGSKRSVLTGPIVAAAILSATVPGTATSATTIDRRTADAAVAADVPSSWTLAGVVMFARHGLRAPQSPVLCSDPKQANCMNAQSARPWPSFGVGAGNLLPQGYDRSRVLGAFLRKHYAGMGLLPRQGCPTAMYAVALFADDERTAMTAGGLADGMAPDCAVATTTDSDIYTPEEKACTNLDPKMVREAAAAFVGGSWADVANGEMRQPIAAMDAIVGRYSDVACKGLGLPEGCSIASGRATRTHPGAIDLASTPAELFLMEYGAGFPTSDVAWGRLEKITGRSLPKALEFVNRLHALDFAAYNMPIEIASPMGSKALDNIVSTLDEMVTRPHKLMSKFVIFVGHDNTILNIAGMLGFKWQLEGYAPYQVPPGGAIAFELWWTRGGDAMVRSVYFAQTPRQLRTGSPLGGSNPPAKTLLPVAGCDGPAGACLWAKFRSIAEAALNRLCTY